jgi:transposase
MSKQRYPEEFTTEAVKQITERGRKMADLSARLGVSHYSLYQWINAHRMSVAQRQAQGAQADELHKLKAELKRVTDERDILKKAAAYFAKQSG